MQYSRTCHALTRIANSCKGEHCRYNDVCHRFFVVISLLNRATVNECLRAAFIRILGSCGCLVQYLFSCMKLHAYQTPQHYVTNLPAKHICASKCVDATHNETIRARFPTLQNAFQSCESALSDNPFVTYRTFTTGHS